MPFNDDAIYDTPVGKEERRRVITLCGSMRFRARMMEEFVRLQSQGYVVMTPTLSPTGEWVPTPEQKLVLDAVHLQKIDMSDEVYVIDVGGYVGWSTSREVSYAREKGKVVSFYSKQVTNPEVVEQDKLMASSFQEVADLRDAKINELQSTVDRVVELVSNSAVNSDGHGACWYDRDTLVEIASAVGLELKGPRELPARSEFEEGCRRYQSELYGEHSPKSMTLQHVASILQHIKAKTGYGLAFLVLQADGSGNVMVARADNITQQVKFDNFSSIPDFEKRFLWDESSLKSNL